MLGEEKEERRSWPGLVSVLGLLLLLRTNRGRLSVRKLMCRCCSVHVYVYIVLRKVSGIYAVWQLASEMKSERDRLRKKGFFFHKKRGQGGRGDAGGKGSR